jgi:hypothetical protein
MGPFGANDLSSANGYADADCAAVGVL